jgi:hypothetical protein
MFNLFGGFDQTLLKQVNPFVTRSSGAYIVVQSYKGSTARL